ncbi:hypothetical protein Elgi_26210 [Paenibacillus elgii]|uniref:S-layer homology domain-containing protein n=1 Tax=Paenibacillus elgii TaxID=189691 RepID=UPI002D7C0AFD|nr:hypothetical protein Elgi_26210 [Paenibacillus elgii]
MIGANLSSTYQVVRVTAQLEGVVLELQQGKQDICRKQGCFEWSGKMNIGSLTRGVKKVTLTAEDSRGNIAARQLDVTYDKKPVIQVTSPKAHEVVTPMLRLQATCTDDDTVNGCLSFIAVVNGKEIKAKDSIDQEVSLADLDGQSKEVAFIATDSASQVSAYSVRVHVDKSGRLVRLDRVEGEEILDVDANRILYYRLGASEAKQIVLKDRTSGEETVIYKEENGTRIHDVCLTPYGVIFGVDQYLAPSQLWEWRDGRLLKLDAATAYVRVNQAYALYSRPLDPNDWRAGNILVLRDLKTGTSQDIFTAKRMGDAGDLTADGKVVFSATESENQQIYQYDKGTVTQITYDTSKTPYSPVTDGKLIVYKEGKGKYLTAIVVHGPTGTQILSESTDYVSPGRDYQVNSGWIAFTRDNGTSVRQVWVRSPEGELRQISDMNKKHHIAYVTSRGDVAFFNDSGLYLSENSAEGRRNYIRLSSRLVDQIWAREQVLGAIYGTLFSIRTGPDTVAPTWPTASRLNAADVRSSSVRLSWSAAEDDTMVTGYKLFKGSDLIATVTGTTYDVTGLTPSTTYRFKVEAGDAEGNWSTTGPAADVTTKPMDKTAPVITDVVPANGATVATATPTVSAKITDADSGVKPDSVKVKVGDQTQKATYDAATSTVTAVTYSLANGSYTLQIDAEDQEGNKAESKTSFTVSIGSSPSTCCNTSHGWGGGAASTPEGTFTKQQIEELIKKAGDTPGVTIETGKSHEVTLPKEVGELLQQADKTLKVDATGGSVDIPASVLSALAKLAGSDATIKVRLTPIDPTAENALIQAAGQASGAAVRIGGSFYDIALIAVEKDGTERRLSGFDQPVTLTLHVNTTDTELPLVGVYYLNEQQQRWEYEGGEASTEGNIRVALRHTSKYAVLEYKKSYADVATTHWAHRYVQALSAKHIAEGVSGDKFAPEQLVTRAEFVALLVRALGLPQASADKPLAYSDVEANAWYHSAVASAVQAGLVQGTDSTRFAPDARITREQMAVLLVRALEHKKGGVMAVEGKLDGYADEGDISAWAKAEVSRAIGAGLMEGRENGKFVPAAQTTRAEATTVIYKLLQN